MDELGRRVAQSDPSSRRPVVFLTGAGMSVASGIPTFRGPEGYWTVGSTVYRPEDMATHATWRRMPRELWRWYLYRKGICNGAEPNPGHTMLAELEADLPEHTFLITQNVDGLHRRAGYPPERMCEVHGCIDLMRDIVTEERHPIPRGLARTDPAAPLTEAEFEALVSPLGNPCRPHVLWFDESYVEALYRSDTALRVAARASVLVVLGTSGAAALPYYAAEVALSRGALLVDINPGENPFRELASRHGGLHLDMGAVEGLAAVCSAVRAACS